MCDEIREKTDKSLVYVLRIHQPVLVNMTKKTSSVEEHTFIAWMW